jgi:hypothetical protein
MVPGGISAPSAPAFEATVAPMHLDMPEFIF